jgi:polysaccharide biosynthesis/export protein
VEWKIEHGCNFNKTKELEFMTAHLLRFFAATALLASAATLAGAQSNTAEGTGMLLGPNDQLMIRALDAEEISDKTYRINPSGDLTLPMIGTLKAAGQTVGQLEEEIASMLRKYIRQPKVAVTVTEFHSQPASVIGAVTTPGIVQLQGKKTLVEVLSMAGGLRQDAGQSVMITRQKEWGLLPLPGAKPDATGQFSTAEVRLKDVLEARNPEQNITIRPNDIISVLRAESVYVLGAVKSAGKFVLNERDALSVLQALSLAGGLERTAAPQKAKILRITPGAVRRTEVPLDLKTVFSGKTTDVILQPDDILFIPDSAQKRAALRTLEALMSIGTTAGAGVILYH